ncbi:hypothetical protein HPB47_023894 [Ixodes persulcatus]|uniref:Uncharacterized protein n=1 Tax=Ixodes persulcatus TaxID=34615 RepID=A0AC60Q5T1_IXOPE|nr:hypothetical protein HPB47_023894 [Ixodes persulcatus]
MRADNYGGTADEGLIRGHQKENGGHLLRGDGFGMRADNYGGTVSGPWVFGMIDVEGKELLLIQICKRETDPSLAVEDEAAPETPPLAQVAALLHKWELHLNRVREQTADQLGLLATHRVYWPPSNYSWQH